MPHAAKGLLGATEAPDDREELASIQITSETGETSTVLQSLIQLQKSGTVLPQSFPEWEEQDMRTLLNTITEAHRFLEVNHIEPRRNLMLWGRHAFSLVQRAFEARELIDGRVIFLASLYVQLMGRTTNALEIQAMDWVQELKMAEKNSMSEDFIHDLTQQIGKVQREIEQTGAELRFHTLIGVTIVHVLSQFLVFTQRELGIVLCYLAWIQDIGTFETLLQHCNEQLQNIDVHLRLNREQAQAITPELLTIHQDAPVQPVTSYSEIHPAQWLVAIKGIAKDSSVQFEGLEAILKEDAINQIRAQQSANHAYIALLHFLAEFVTSAIQMNLGSLVDGLVANNTIHPPPTTPAIVVTVPPLESLIKSLGPQGLLEKQASCPSVLEVRIRLARLEDVLVVLRQVIGCHRVNRVTNFYDEEAVRAEPTVTNGIRVEMLVAHPQFPACQVMCTCWVLLEECDRTRLHRIVFSRILDHCQDSIRCAAEFAGIHLEPRSLKLINDILSTEDTAVVSVWKRKSQLVQPPPLNSSLRSSVELLGTNSRWSNRLASLSITKPIPEFE